MNKIIVKLNEDSKNGYFWVDTVVRHDEYEYICAVLFNPRNGAIFARDISTIEVVCNENKLKELKLCE